MKIELTARERRMMLDRLYDHFVALGDAFNDPHIDRADKRRLRTDRRALARLINKLEGTEALNNADLK